MLNTLQAGRGLAALAVLLFHASIATERSTGVAPFWEVMQFGNRGVDFFFVLSGFIIIRAHKTHIGQPKMWINFLQKRFVRIFPIYWFYTGLVILALVAGLGKYPLPNTGADWLTTFSLFRFTDVVTPLPQAWTLFHEILFYFGFSLLIIYRPLGCIVLTGWFIVSAASLQYFLAPTDPTLVFLNSYNINFAFGMGAFYALSYIKGFEFAVAGLGILFVIAATSIISFPSYLLFGLGFAFLVTAGVSIEEKRSISIPMARLLGNASYSIYLTHEVAIAVGTRVCQTINVTDPYLSYTIIVTISIVAGVLAFQLFERPLLNLLNGKPVFSRS